MKKLLFLLLLFFNIPADAGFHDLFIRALYHDQNETVEEWCDLTPSPIGGMPLPARADGELVALLPTILERMPKKDENGDTLLFSACASNLPLVVRELLRRGADVNEMSRGMSALTIAAGFGHEEVVDTLLQHNPDTNITEDENGLNALHMAARLGKAKTVYKLLQHGMSVDPMTSERVTPLILACQGGAFLNQDGSLDKIKAAGPEEDFVATVKMLLERDANVNHKADKKGLTPLHTAIAAGNRKIARVLINNGADVTAQSDRGETPSDLIKMRSYFDLEKAIKERDGIFPCTVCSQDAKTRCSICKQSYYCSPECQRTDWRGHKTRCKEAHVDTECSICSLPMSDNVLRVLPCTHGFHRSCVNEWLERDRSCPLCKRVV